MKNYVFTSEAETPALAGGKRKRQVAGPPEGGATPGHLHQPDSGTATMRKKKMTAIVPAAGLYLQPYVGNPSSPVDVTSFVHTFRKTWQRIPADDRRILQGYWRGLAKPHRESVTDPRGYYPLVTLDGQLLARELCLAACKEDGRWLVFCTLLLDSDREGAVAEEIAHTLALALRYATGCAQEVRDSLYDPVLKQGYQSQDRGEFDPEASQRQLGAAIKRHKEIEERAAFFILQRWGFKGVLSKIDTVFPPPRRRR
jgi:hypothetical protein